MCLGDIAPAVAGVRGYLRALLHGCTWRHLWYWRAYSSHPTSEVGLSFLFRRTEHLGALIFYFHDKKSLLTFKGGGCNLVLAFQRITFVRPYSIFRALLSLFSGVSPGFVEKRYVGIAGMDFIRMGNTRRDVVAVAFCSTESATCHSYSCSFLSGCCPSLPATEAQCRFG
jgi:hypothetical protein